MSIHDSKEHFFSVLLGAAPNAGTITKLAEMLRNSEPTTRQMALRAIKSLGPAAAVPEILAELPRLMRDHGGIPSGAIGQLSLANGRSTLTRADVAAAAEQGFKRMDSLREPGTLRQLGALPKGGGTGRRSAGWVVRGLLARLRLPSSRRGPAVLNIPLGDGRLQLQIPQGGCVEAMQAVGSLGAGGAQPEIVGELLRLLGDKGPGGQYEAAKALAQMMSGGVRLFPVAFRTVRIRTVAELVS